MAQFFKPQTKRVPAKIALTSLMDVLTIILVFLLTNYSEEAPDPNISPDVSLPIIQGKSEKRVAEYARDIKVSFGVHKLEIGDEVISFKNFDEQQDQVLDIAVKKIGEKLKGLSPKEMENSVITVHADKEVRYNMIEGLVKAAAAAGITQLEFVGLFEKTE